MLRAVYHTPTDRPIFIGPLQMSLGRPLIVSHQIWGQIDRRDLGWSRTSVYDRSRPNSAVGPSVPRASRYGVHRPLAVNRRRRLTGLCGRSPTPIRRQHSAVLTFGRAQTRGFSPSGRLFEFPCANSREIRCCNRSIVRSGTGDSRSKGNQSAICTPSLWTRIRSITDRCPTTRNASTIFRRAFSRSSGDAGILKTPVTRCCRSGP